MLLTSQRAISEVILPVHTFVDLAGPVTVRDLQQFLECVPENADLDRDLRWSESKNGVTRYLGLSVLVGGAGR